MNLGKDVSEDTSAGRLILNNCTTVLIAAAGTASKQESGMTNYYVFLILSFPPLGGWSGTESTIIEATNDLVYRPRMVMSVEQSVE
jgi:hypothetical protein